MKDSSVKRWSALHAYLYRLTRGVIGRRFVDNDILLLTTKRHRTGDDHTVPLLYLTDADRYIVIASYGGRPAHPAWYQNVVAEPHVRVQVGARRQTMLARTAGPEERERWWPRIVAAYGDYDVYQSRTGRQIPVVFLEPLEASQQSAS
jgi:deazaflavin-dependent oxidoreductase (nitroreductase family)